MSFFDRGLSLVEPRPIGRMLVRHALGLGLLVTLALCSPDAGKAGSWSEDQFHSDHPGQTYHSDVSDQQPMYSFPVNTDPDGWAALKAEPWIGSQRLTKVYDGTLFLVIGAVPGWKLVRFKSGERGWIAERLVGCCRPASH